MKTKIILTSLALMLAALVTSISYSQESCCSDKSAACCTETAACCTDNVSSNTESIPAVETTGNAAGDSTKSGTVCVVSGEAIGEGQGVKFDYYGKTYDFCCEGCLAKFKKDPMDHIKGAIECPVMGDAIETKDVFVMHNSTKYYLCCESCVKAFEKNPDKYIGQK